MSLGTMEKIVMVIITGIQVVTEAVTLNQEKGLNYLLHREMVNTL